MAFIYHLRKNAGDNNLEKKFKKKSEIFQTLSNRSHRKSYDLDLKVKREGAKQSEGHSQSLTSFWWAPMTFFLMKAIFLWTPAAQSEKYSSTLSNYVMSGCTANDPGTFTETDTTSFLNFLKQNSIRQSN